MESLKNKKQNPTQKFRIFPVPLLKNNYKIKNKKIKGQWITFKKNKESRDEEARLGPKESQKVRKREE